MEYQGTGIVTKTSSDSCDVSICIDGRTKYLSFERQVFYSFGFRCEGNMDNILDEGMEVELCYSISESGDPCVVAAWLGDKPDSFSDDEYSDISSEDDIGVVYGQVGRVIANAADSFIVQADGYEVVVGKDVVFRDGCRLDEHSTLELDEDVTFDAVPTEPEDPEGPSHQATCAWLGQQPSLADRFNLDSVESDEDMELEILQRQNVYGTVVVIPNEVVALVEVEFESVLFKVMLFRNSFKPPCERIQDMVSVGDSVCMRLKYSCLLPDRRRWFAVKAVKDEACSFDSDESSESGSSVASAPSSSDVVLYSQPPLKGTISPVSYDSACINYNDFKIFVDRDKFYLDQQKGGVGYFMLYVSPNKNTVNFEAVPTTLPGFTHEATCAWVGKKPSCVTLLSSLPPPKPALLEERGQVFYGFVSNLWFPNLAFVDIPGESTTVRIHSSNISGIPKYMPEATDDLITNFVRLKDCVKFKLWKINHNAVLGWDAHVTPFSKDTWENANVGVFVSRGPCENLEMEGLTFRETAKGGVLVLRGPCENVKREGFPVSGEPVVSGPAEAEAARAKKKRETTARKVYNEERAARWRAKKTAEALRNASADSLPPGKSQQPNASAEGPCGSPNARTAGSTSNRKERAARRRAKKASEALGNASANSLPSGKSHQADASALGSWGSLNARTAGTTSNRKERAARRRAKKAADCPTNMAVSKTSAVVGPASVARAPKDVKANAVVAKTAAGKSTKGNRIVRNSAEKLQRNCKAGRAALTNKIIEGVASLSVSTKGANAGGKPARGKSVGNPQGNAKGAGAGSNQTAGIQARKAAVPKNAGKNAPQKPASKNAAAKNSPAQSSKRKSAAGNARSKNAAAKNSAAQNANPQIAGKSKPAEKSTAAKSPATKKAAIRGSSSVTVANNALTGTAKCASCKKAENSNERASPVKQGGCLLS